MSGARDLQKPLLRKEARHSNNKRVDAIDESAIEAQKSEVSGLMRLLTKPSPLDGLCPSPPDFLEFRCKNLQWRKGHFEGTHGEITDLESSVSEPSAIGMSRCSSWPLLPQRAQSSRKLWMLSPDLESDLKRGFPQIWHRLQSHLGLLIQMVVLVLVVCTYAACPLTVSWASVVGHDERGPIKGRPFKESSVIVVSRALIAVVGIVLSATIGGRAHVRQCFDRRAIIRFTPAGIGWALADVCEVLAVARIDPATYGVISQARLLGAAAACWLIRGMRQTSLQWGVLLSLSLVCMSYCLVPDETGSVTNKVRLLNWRLSQAEVRINWYPPELEADKLHSSEKELHEYLIGSALALGKVALSVLSGVYGETCFKFNDGSPPPELHIQMTQISFSSCLAAVAGYFALCWEYDENPGEFFQGPDGYWTWQTVVVACVYCWREWICNLCVKRFDSLVKNICNAVALVLTYFFTVVVTQEKPFNALKVLLLLAAVAEVVNYVATRRGGGDAPPAAEAKAKEDAAAPNARKRTQSDHALVGGRREVNFEAKEL